MIVGLVHPGQMGSAVGEVLRENGHEILWASAGRSDATRARAASFRDVGSPAALAGEADVILSICPPHTALDVARALSGFDGIYIDANAVSPMTAGEIAALHERFVDGGIIGGPPTRAGTTRLYLTGADAAAVAGLFTGGVLDVRHSANASALKMTYAAWSKGTAALLLALEDVARHFGVDRELADERALSEPELHERLERARGSAATKGWRWVGEMEEIADTFAAAGAPPGFHRAAAEVYRS